MPLDPHDLRDAIALWPQLAGATGRLINHSENHTFRFGDYTLRVHRPDYQSPETIDSELAWLQALRRDTDLPIAEPVPGANGLMLQHFRTSGGEPRYAVLFRFIRGTEPDMGSDLTGLFAKLGTYAATLHQHAITWQRPPAFTRQAWNAASILDADGLWGNWRVAPGVNGANRPLIEQAVKILRRNLDAYGADPEQYGLIHADMRLGNLLVDGDTVSLIDFDDSGFCWFTYDFAASISFYETHPSVPELRRAWLQAYQQVRPLSPADIASLDSMILLRRLALLAWIGTHAETKLAQHHVPGFAKGTAELAERYLVRG
ncbi:phosphotransferase enzyme family protein [Devosia rhizoryzae]|uniref:Phosphotransferase n=1 Tax=Devosia rhizoryzae TaxID=2774137 RepID=A0ABX7CAT6_9HYPH|nr:phosphotransferase [Devosia rhizoryzae]QQR40903.1 phosphotransferase [Devosia rhizoryzae]